MAEVNQGGQPTPEEGITIAITTPAEPKPDVPYVCTDEYMAFRLQKITLTEDKQYPRFRDGYLTRRWHWEVGEDGGDAAFAITALLGALRASRSQRPSLLQVMQGSLKHNNRGRRIDNPKNSNN